MKPYEMERLTRDTPVKAEKIRLLFDNGVSRSEIANFLGISYQHVQNVLKRSGRLASTPDVGNTPGAPTYWVVQIAKGGYFKLPEEYLNGESLEPGDVLVCRKEGHALQLMSRVAATNALREAAQRHMPAEAALLDALILDD